MTASGPAWPPCWPRGSSPAWPCSTSAIPAAPARPGYAPPEGRLPPELAGPAICRSARGLRARNASDVGSSPLSVPDPSAFGVAQVSDLRAEDRITARITRATGTPSSSRRPGSRVRPWPAWAVSSLCCRTPPTGRGWTSTRSTAELGRICSAIDGTAAWKVKLHPYRVSASADRTGQPAPEGRHRDGVTFITSLMIGRTNAAGGESGVYTDKGEHLPTCTLSEPGDLLLGDDRRTVHSVTPVMTPVPR
ncbi:2OG-Fe dioxygenase family protein [Streptomyces hundungensis]|uniref:2OG-Fe dioxygenase family protein n=1 Tax=Streptomyces hundungensis TaxID=1077946 RepID=UPI0033D4DC1F